MSSARAAVVAAVVIATALAVFVSCDTRALLSGLPSPSITPPDPDPAADLGPRRWNTALVVGGEPLERVPCPDDEMTAQSALDTADRLFEAAELPAAYACAEIAADLAPQAVEAHHLRGAALATMGHILEAQVAFAMALALDPDDPETLAATADFYINVFRPRSRDQLLLGLEYARRGSERAATRRRADRQLRARLSLLEAEALNDLGSADLAVRRVKDALALSPGWVEAEHELGVSLFNLCKFDDAAAAFARVLAAAADDPYAHFHSGLIDEFAGKIAEAEAHFARARKLAPAEFFAPLDIDAAAFRAELDKAVSELDEDSKKLMGEVALEVTSLPALADLTAVDPPFSPTILGLYRGLPVGVEETPLEPSPSVDPSGNRPLDAVASVDGAIPPRAVVLYRNNLLRVSRTRAELDSQIRRTLRHELGHADGLDEDELRRQGLE